MEGFLRNRPVKATEKIYGQKVVQNGDVAKLWPSQRSTVARLGLLRRSRCASLASGNFESSDTLSSPSSSKTSLFSEESLSPVSSGTNRFPLAHKGLPTPKKLGSAPVSPVAVQFDRNEVLEALKLINPQTESAKPSEDSILHKKHESQISQIGIRNEENEKSWEESQSKLSGHESWVTCADFTNSMILKMKSPKERQEFAELCSQALSVKLETYDQIVKKNSELYELEMERVNNIDRDEYKSHLCKVMLKLITNEKQRQEQKYRNSELQLKTRTKRKYGKKGMKQVYVVGGRTILGDPNENENFPHTFSPLSDLVDPKDDPPGYDRFKVEVDMKALDGDKFLIQLHNDRTLVFTAKDNTSDVITVSATVQLPPGIFADKLKIARKGNGPLIIQEPWIF